MRLSRFRGGFHTPDQRPVTSLLFAIVWFAALTLLALVRRRVRAFLTSLTGLGVAAGASLLSSSPDGGMCCTVSGHSPRDGITPCGQRLGRPSNPFSRPPSEPPVAPAPA